MKDEVIRLEGSELGKMGEEIYQVVASPEFAKPLKMYVRPARSRVRGQVLKRNYDVALTEKGPNYITRHRTFSAAVRSAHYRGKRYIKAYSVERRVLPGKTVTA